jgi:hypothetical protein
MRPHLLVPKMRPHLLVPKMRPHLLVSKGDLTFWYQRVTSPFGVKGWLHLLVPKMRPHLWCQRWLRLLVPNLPPLVSNLPPFGAKSPLWCQSLIETYLNITDRLHQHRKHSREQSWTLRGGYLYNV